NWQQGVDRQVLDHQILAALDEVVDLQKSGYLVEVHNLLDQVQLSVFGTGRLALAHRRLEQIEQVLRVAVHHVEQYSSEASVDDRVVEHNLHSLVQAGVLPQSGVPPLLSQNDAPKKGRPGA